MLESKVSGLRVFLIHFRGIKKSGGGWLIFTAWIKSGALPSALSAPGSLPGSACVLHSFSPSVGEAGMLDGRRAMNECLQPFKSSRQGNYQPQSAWGAHLSRPPPPVPSLPPAPKVQFSFPHPKGSFQFLSQPRFLDPPVLIKTMMCSADRQDLKTATLIGAGGYSSLISRSCAQYLCPQILAAPTFFLKGGRRFLGPARCY